MNAPMSDDALDIGSFRRPSRSPLALATVAGMGLGVAYAASPFTLWFLIAMVGLFTWAGRGLTGRERRSVWAILSVAVALRLIAVIILFVGSDHHRMVSFFWDGDGIYLKNRGLWIRNIRLGIPLPPYYFTLSFDRSYGWTSYLYVLAYLQYLLGPAPYGVHLINVALFLATAVGLYRLVRKSYGQEAALIGFALLLFLPTPFAWSVSALKESLYVFLVAVPLIAIVTVLRSGPVLRRAFALALVVGSIAVIDGVRSGGRAIAVVGLAAGLAGSVVARRVSLVLALLAVLVVTGRQLLTDPAAQARIMSQLKIAAVQHIGNVRTTGHGYQLLDERFYALKTNDAIGTMTPVEGLRFVARALVSFLIVPLPWQIQSLSEMAFLPQQILWYAMVLLAFVGLAAGLRRDPLVTCMLAGVTVAGAAAIAISEGNVGTMVRHRDTLMPFLVWLSALGAVRTVGKCLSEKPSTIGPDDRADSGAVNIQ